MPINNIITEGGNNNEITNYPKAVDLNVDYASYWKGLGRQKMTFNQVLNELTDNAISAAVNSTNNKPLPFEIKIFVEKRGEKVVLWVVDKGIGIKENEILKRIFKPGGRGENRGILNEHGFGLKHSLAILTGGDQNKEWSLFTRDKVALSEDKVFKVKGPFSNELKLDLVNEDESRLFNEYCDGSTGTIIKVETSFAFFGTLYNRGKVFDTLIIRLVEHLGVNYKHYVRNTFNSLQLFWREIPSGENVDENIEWRKVRIHPIEIQYDSNGLKKKKLPIPGDPTVIADVNIGMLDVEGTVNPENSPYDDEVITPYPLKIYYLGNTDTQGLDIVVRNRLIQTAQFYEIWGIKTHNDYNRYIGEVILNDNRIKTVNNKTSLDPNDSYTINLYDILKEPIDEEINFRPTKVTRTYEELSVKKRIKRSLEERRRGSVAELEKTVFGGVKIDIFYKEDENTIEVMEVKRDTVAPIDVYQLLMYWDGIVHDEQKSPSTGRLIGKRIPDKIKTIIESINMRKDALNNSYNLEYHELDSYLGDLE